MEKKEAVKIAKEFFTHYPKSDALFVTKDGQVFFTENDATNHARSLDPKKIEFETVLRGFVEDELTDEQKAAAEVAKKEAAPKKTANEKTVSKKAAPEKAPTELPKTKAADKEAAGNK